MGLEEKLPSGVLLTTVEGLAGYARKNSLWPATFGLACCAIEMMATGAGRYDLARFGMEVFRASPRQADLMIVAGRVSQKMAPVLRQIYDQMSEPKWVLAMGACASSGGMFNNYAVVQGVDHVVPVDMYLPGCPPRPEMLMDAILKIHDQIQHEKLGSQRRAQVAELELGCAGRPAHLGDEGPAAVSDTRPEVRPSRPGFRRPRSSPAARACSASNGTGDTSGFGGLSVDVALPSSSPEPYGDYFDEVADTLASALPDHDAAVEAVLVDRGELTFHVRREHLLAFMQTMRDDADLRFEMCLGVSGVHFPDQERSRAPRGLPAAVLHAQPPGPGRGVGARRRPAPAVGRLGLPRQRLARARDLRLLRHGLRRPPGADPHPDAGRLAGSPAAQGLPAGRHPRGVQGRRDPAAGRAEGLQLMSTTDDTTTNVTYAAAGIDDDYAGSRETTEGTIYTVTGQDWDSVVQGVSASGQERIVVNMGPQHPSTHGVLRLILELDGETVTEARVGIGYLHTGIEKNLEYRSWTQGVTFVTRMDYLSPFFNETAYCLAVEKLLGITEQIPERATVIRVMMMELNRMSSHLVALATGGMELGALTAMIFGFRERETILDIFELVTGLRMNHAYIRPGGVAQDLPPGAVDQIAEAVTLLRKNFKDTASLLVDNGIWMARTEGVGYLDLSGCMALGITGPCLRATGLPWDLRKEQPYCGYETYDFDVVTADHERRLRPVPDPSRRARRVAQDRRAVPRPAPPRPGHGRGQEDRLARRSWPSVPTAWATPSTTSGTSWASRWRP